MLNNIISELKNLKGTEVKIFGQSCNYPNEVEIDTIDTIDVLENLLPYEISNQFVIYNYLDNEEDKILRVSFEEYCEIEEYEEIKADNTYNWNAPISNDMHFRIYESCNYEGIIVELAVHKYGDVRCNYTDECYLQFDSIEEFYNILLDCNKYFSITKNNIEYNIEINIFDDCPNIEIITEDNIEYIEGYEAIKLLEILLNK